LNLEEAMKDPRIREALLYKEMDGKVRCNTCERRCEMGRGGLGFCRTRKNIEGKLYTLVYGDISSIAVHPIEHKPLFHFYPGSRVLTLSTWSCNFECGWCFRKYLSRASDRVGKGEFLPPADLVNLIKQHNCQGTAISFNEPTLLFEWCLDAFPLVKREGYYNTYITNGYMSLEALRLLAEHGLDAMNIDIKGDAEVVRKHCGGEVEKVWRNAIEAKRLGIWVEITTLIVPHLTDNEECLQKIASRIKEELGQDTPWHVDAYFSRDDFASEFYGAATPESTLVKAREIGKREGLNYVYAGGYSGPYQNTYCPSCQELLIERYGFGFDGFRYRMKNKRCSRCGKEIPIIREPAAR
jgi:pyruvate formate lyase activating enzyme